MLQFYIYEDDLKFRKQMEQMIDKIMIQNNEAYQIDWNLSLEKEIFQQGIKTIYVIDIDSLGERAFSIAHKIRKTDLNSFLVFHTNYIEDRLNQITHLELMCSLVINDEKGMQRFSKLIRLILNQTQFLVIQSNSVIYRFRMNDILYIMSEKMNHHILIVTNDMKVSVVGSLSKIKKSLNDYFVYSHRSCLVNINRVKLIDKNRKILKFNNGMELDVFSYRRIKDMQNELKNIL